MSGTWRTGAGLTLGNDPAKRACMQATLSRLFTSVASRQARAARVIHSTSAPLWLTMHLHTSNIIHKYNLPIDFSCNGLYVKPIEVRDDRSGGRVSLV